MPTNCPPKGKSWQLPKKAAIIGKSNFINKSDMLPIKKQIVEELLENSQLPVKEKLDLIKYAGVIKLEKDPLEYQKEIRDEW